MNFRTEIAFAPLQLASRFNAKFSDKFSGEKTPPNASPHRGKIRRSIGLRFAVQMTAFH